MGQFAIQKRKLYEEVMEQILKLLVNGNYGIGDRLPSLQELSQMFEVGKPTLREALSVLCSQGTLEIRHGSGIFVKRLSSEPQLDYPIYLGEVESKNLLSMLEFRKAIEVETAGLAAKRRTQEDINAIEEALHLMEVDIAAGQISANWDYKFHERIAIASHNSIFVQVITTTKQLLQLYFESSMRQSLAIPTRRNMVAVEHRIILPVINRNLFVNAVI